MRIAYASHGSGGFEKAILLARPNERFVPQSRLCLANRAAPSTNVCSGDPARRRQAGAVGPLWAETDVGSKE